MKKKLRYVQVGTGQRSWMYTTALMKEHAKDGPFISKQRANFFDFTNV